MITLDIRKILFTDFHKLTDYQKRQFFRLIDIPFISEDLNASVFFNRLECLSIIRLDHYLDLTNFTNFLSIIGEKELALKYKILEIKYYEELHTGMFTLSKFFEQNIDENKFNIANNKFFEFSNNFKWIDYNNCYKIKSSYNNQNSYIFYKNNISKKYIREELSLSSNKISLYLSKPNNLYIDIDCVINDCDCVIHNLKSPQKNYTYICKKRAAICQISTTLNLINLKKLEDFDIPPYIEKPLDIHYSKKRNTSDYKSILENNIDDKYLLSNENKNENSKFDNVILDLSHKKYITKKEKFNYNKNISYIAHSNQEFIDLNDEYESNFKQAIYFDDKYFMLEEDITKQSKIENFEPDIIDIKHNKKYSLTENCIFLCEQKPHFKKDYVDTYSLIDLNFKSTNILDEKYILSYEDNIKRAYITENNCTVNSDCSIFEKNLCKNTHILSKNLLNQKQEILTPKINLLNTTFTNENIFLGGINYHSRNSDLISHINILDSIIEAEKDTNFDVKLYQTNS